MSFQSSINSAMNSLKNLKPGFSAGKRGIGFNAAGFNGAAIGNVVGGISGWQDGESTMGSIGHGLVGSLMGGLVGGMAARAGVAAYRGGIAYNKGGMRGLKRYGKVLSNSAVNSIKSTLKG